MHEIAEYGVAAHWAYKEGIAGGVDQQRLNWFQDILDYQSESSNAEDFVDSVKHDLLNDKVYVFTPDNDVYELPKVLLLLTLPTIFIQKLASIQEQELMGVHP